MKSRGRQATLTASLGLGEQIVGFGLVDGWGTCEHDGLDIVCSG